MKHLLLIACLSFLLIFVGSGIAVSDDATASSFQAGTAKIEITPPAESAVDLLGQPLRLRDPLFARVLVLKDEKVSIAIVSVDLIVFASQKVIAEAKAKWGVDHVILSATHTHAGMNPRGMLIKPPAAPDWTRSGNKTTDVGLLTVIINRDLAFVAIPGEPFIQHQLDLTEKSPIANTFILGLAYHGKGTPFVVDIPTVQAVKEGGYGATECSFLAADAGEKMVAEAVLSIRQLTNSKGQVP